MKTQIAFAFAFAWDWIIFFADKLVITLKNLYNIFQFQIIILNKTALVYLKLLKKTIFTEMRMYLFVSWLKKCLRW